MDWLSLTVQSKKTVLIMMMRASKPIIIRCGPLIEFTNESSVKVSILF